MNMVKKYEQIMKKLNAGDKTYLSGFVKIVNNKLARNILAKMTSKHSAICYENVPLEELGGDNRMQVMSLLQIMEKISLAKSEMVKHEKGTFRQYDVTDEGRDLVNEHMQKELKQYS